MAVHFDFVMEDIDAENMLRALHDRACDYSEDIMEYTVRTDITEEYRKSAIAALRRIQADAFRLIKLMNNEKVRE